MVIAGNRDLGKAQRCAGRHVFFHVVAVAAGGIERQLHRNGKHIGVRIRVAVVVVPRIQVIRGTGVHRIRKIMAVGFCHTKQGIHCVAAADIVMRGQLRTVCVIDIRKRIAGVALRPENIRTGGGGCKFLAVALARRVYGERVGCAQAHGGESVQQRVLRAVDLRLGVSGVAVVKIFNNAIGSQKRFVERVAAAVSVIKGLLCHLIRPAERIGAHRGAGGFLAAIVEVAARAGVGILIIAALVRNNAVAVVRQVILGGTGIAALRFRNGSKRGAGSVIGRSHQIQVVAAVALVQVHAAVAAGGRLRAAAGADRVIRRAAVRYGAGMPVGDQDPLDGNRGIGSCFITGMDVFTVAVAIACVEVAAPIRPAVVRKPARRVTVAAGGIIQDQLINELRPRIVVVFRGIRFGGTVYKIIH